MQRRSSGSKAICLGAALGLSMPLPAAWASAPSGGGPAGAGTPTAPAETGLDAPTGMPAPTERPEAGAPSADPAEGEATPAEASRGRSVDDFFAEPTEAEENAPAGPSTGRIAGGATMLGLGVLGASTLFLCDRAPGRGRDELCFSATGVATGLLVIAGAAMLGSGLERRLRWKRRGQRAQSRNVRIAPVLARRTLGLGFSLQY